MGVCRMLVYITAALAISVSLPSALVVAALVLLAYLIGLTYTAKREHLNELGSVQPLAALAVPMIYGVVATSTATCLPSITALHAARTATSVLPNPTSPQSRRSIGNGRSMSRLTSSITRS